MLKDWAVIRAVRYNQVLLADRMFMPNLPSTTWNLENHLVTQVISEWGLQDIFCVLTYAFNLASADTHLELCNT